MFIIVCRDHGNVEISYRERRDQAATDDRWRCPICRLFAQCIEVPDVAVGCPCLTCGKATTIKSLWDDRHRHFFCNVLCVMDYDQQIKDELKGHRKAAEKGGSSERIKAINRSRRKGDKRV